MKDEMRLPMFMKVWIAFIFIVSFCGGIGITWVIFHFLSKFW